MWRKLLTGLVAALLLAALPATAARGQGGGAGAPKAGREVAVTFDDLPTPYGGLERMRAIMPKLTGAVKLSGAPAVGFVNEVKLFKPGEMDERTALLQAWLDAGFELGNHTYSHVSMKNVPLEAYKENVIRGETVTALLLGQRGRKLRYFRHPFLWTGVTPEYKRGLEEFLAGRGYTIAPVTIDNNDYIFADVYYKARQRGDDAVAARVAAAYLTYMEEVFAFFERLSAETFGREVKQILLLHSNEINADHFGELAAMLGRRGYKFITLDEALGDPAYRLPDAQTPHGLSWLHRWRAAKGLEVKMEPDEPAFVSDLYKAWRQ